MANPNVDPSLNLEVEALDELGRKVSPEQTDDTAEWIPAAEQLAPEVGRPSPRQSQQSELSTCDFGDVAK